MSEKCFYLTGTDTEVGKTFASASLLHAFNQSGRTALGMKPVASGCVYQEKQLLNDDALSLMHFSARQLDYSLVNPYAFEPAIAPHIAARESGIELRVKDLVHHVDRFRQETSDIKLIEGAGGWFVPLNEKETLADFAKVMNVPVILVVAIRLGCINHALLSVQAIENSGLNLAGWIANDVDDGYEKKQENIDTLSSFIQAPLLAAFNHYKSGSFQEKVEQAAKTVSSESLSLLGGS